MNSDDFEKRLQRVPLREIPPDWRESILRRAAPSQPSTLDPRPSFFSTLFWPNPKAWAGLAAVWVLIFALRLGASGGSPMVAAIPTPSSPDVVATFKDQQKILVELIGSNEPQEIDKPRQFPVGPQSERQSSISMV